MCMHLCNRKQGNMQLIQTKNSKIQKYEKLNKLYEKKKFWNNLWKIFTIYFVIDKLFML